MEDRKRSSSVPPACPFWSDGVQTGHALEHMRPLDLDGRHQPVPHDDELENSPKPLQEMPSGLQSVGQFESPASERGRPAEPSGVENHVEAAVEPERIQAETENGDSAGARRSERAWRRRGHAADRSVRADLGTDGKVEMNGKELEKELGDQVLQHVQHETARLQQQNDELQRELQKMREERDRHVALAVPPSWVPKSPPRMTPSMESHGAWVSPESFHCTPNGTRVPPGPPPPDPPALPVWPPEISSVEPSVEPPRKIRGVMGGNGNRSSDVCSPRAARNLWLEREVAALQEKLDQEALKNKQLSGYWSTMRYTAMNMLHASPITKKYTTMNILHASPITMKYITMNMLQASPIWLIKITKRMLSASPITMKYAVMASRFTRHPTIGHASLTFHACY